MINNFIELKNKIKDDNNLLITRLGNVEATDLLTDEGIYSQMFTNAGFYCNDENIEEVYKNWKSKYVEAICKSDAILDVYTCSSFHIVGDVFTRLNITNPGLPYIENPRWWIENIILQMKGTIGIVSYFKNDIEKQIKKLNKIWGIDINNKFVVVKSYNTIKGNEPHNNWSETYDDLVERLDKHKHVKNWLVSCGCYGLPVCLHLSKIDKSKVFYVGGLLQLLFGLKGSRWDKRLEVNSLYNKHWVYPSERPKNANIVEDWCYGK